MKKYLLPFAMISLIISCQTAPVAELPEPEPAAITEPVEENTAALKTVDDLPFPKLVNTSKKPFNINSMIAGQVVSVSDDDLGLKQIVVETEKSYYYKDQNVTVKYNFVFGGLNTVTVAEGTVIKTGDFIGEASFQSYVTAYSDSIDNYMMRMTANKPFRMGDDWYFSPDWIIAGKTAWMTFRPVDDFKAAVIDFYTRWAIEENEPKGATIHHFDNLDRIRAVVRLDQYPVPGIRDTALKLVEDFYYNGQYIFVLQTKSDDIYINGHKVVIYWQKNFDNYLRDEYVLGDELYIYASIYAIDHEEKEILVCVRDFAKRSDEEVIEERLTGLK